MDNLSNAITYPNGNTAGQLNVPYFGDPWAIPCQQQPALAFEGPWLPKPRLIIPEEPMKLTAKSHAVVSRETGLVVEVCDSHQDAVAAAKRRAAKDQDEFMVFSPACTVRPKPVDVEVVTLP